MNIAEALEQALGQAYDLNENDWYCLHDQCQVFVLKNRH